MVSGNKIHKSIKVKWVLVKIEKGSSKWCVVERLTWKGLKGVQRQYGSVVVVVW